MVLLLPITASRYRKKQRVVFTYTLLFEREHLLAAIAPSSSAASKYRGRAIPKIPIFHLAGRQDTLVKMSWQQVTIDTLRRSFECEESKPWGDHPNCEVHPSSDGNFLFTYVHDGGHRMPNDAGKMFARFFQNDARSNKANSIDSNREH